MAACGASLNINGDETYSGSQSARYSAQDTDYKVPSVRASSCDNDQDDCVQIIRTTKRVVIPCKRNVVKNITVQVPRTVVNRVAKQMPYQELEKRVRRVPVVTQREEVRYSNQNQSYTTLVPRLKTTMVPVTRRVPKTVYVNEITTVPMWETAMVPEIRQRSVRVPYKVQIPQTRYSNETYDVPVTKYRTIYEDIPKTIYEPRTKQQCTTVTKMVTKDIPVYSAVPRVPQNYSPQLVEYNNLGRDFTVADTNHDGLLNLEDYTKARKAGLLQDTAALPGGSYNMGLELKQAPIPKSVSIVSKGIFRNNQFDLDGPETPTPYN